MSSGAGVFDAELSRDLLAQGGTTTDWGIGLVRASAGCYQFPKRFHFSFGSFRQLDPFGCLGCHRMAP